MHYSFQQHQVSIIEGNRLKLLPDSEHESACKSRLLNPQEEGGCFPSKDPDSLQYLRSREHTET